jgi:hypothetical protein
VWPCELLLPSGAAAATVFSSNPPRLDSLSLNPTPHSTNKDLSNLSQLETKMAIRQQQQTVKKNLVTCTNWKKDEKGSKPQGARNLLQNSSWVL